MTEALDEIFNRFLKALAHSERAPRDELGRYQQNLIEQLARHAHKHVPFYRDRLSCLFTPQGEIDFARWKEVPIVTRSEAAEHAAEMRAPQLSKSYGQVQEIHTSGSMGIPLTIASNALVSIAANAALTRMARWWAIDTSRAMARIAVFEEGAPGDRIYFILSGGVSIFATLTEEGRSRRLASFGEGVFFGDMAILEGQPRSATVRADTDTEMLYMTVEDFQRLVEGAPVLTSRILLAIARELSHRLRLTSLEVQTLEG